MDALLVWIVFLSRARLKEAEAPTPTAEFVWLAPVLASLCSTFGPPIALLADVAFALAAILV